MVFETAIVSVNMSSRYVGCLNMIQVLDKLRHDVLKHIRIKEILILIGATVFLYFPNVMVIQLYIF
jgi:hypothetical protein